MFQSEQWIYPLPTTPRVQTAFCCQCWCSQSRVCTEACWDLLVILSCVGRSLGSCCQTKGQVWGTGHLVVCCPSMLGFSAPSSSSGKGELFQA